MADRVDLLEARIRQLEHRIRRQQQVAAIAVTLFTSVLTLGALQAQTGR